jgi:glycosyltransferase involved in cell wall biosynthesis
VEAFYAGVPVITSNVTSMPEVAGDAALLVDPFSIDEISNALERIATDEALRKSLIERGNKRAEIFHWDKSAEAMWNCITKALQK